MCKSCFSCVFSPPEPRALGPWVAHLRMTDQWSGTICEILVECIMRNNSVKLFLIWVSGSGEDVVTFPLWCSGSGVVLDYRFLVFAFLSTLLYEHRRCSLISNLYLAFLTELVTCKISIFYPANYDRVSSLKAAAENPLPYHRQDTHKNI